MIIRQMLNFFLVQSKQFAPYLHINTSDLVTGVPGVAMITQTFHKFRPYTLKTGISVEDGDSIFKLLRRVSCPEIQLRLPFLSLT